MFYKSHTLRNFWRNGDSGMIAKVSIRNLSLTHKKSHSMIFETPSTCGKKFWDLNQKVPSRRIMIPLESFHYFCFVKTYWRGRGGILYTSRTNTTIFYTKKSLTVISRRELGNEIRWRRRYNVSKLWLVKRTTPDKYNFKIALPIDGFHICLSICWSKAWLHSILWLRPIVLKK